MTPAPISVERLRELLAKATPGPWEEGTGNFVTLAACHPDNRELIAAAVNAMPALLHQLAELERDNATMRGANYHQVGVEQEQEIIDLEAKLAERGAEVERLRRECDLRKHAVDRWVPCPDHRDKTDGRCQVCAKEAAERAREEFAHVAPLLLDLATSHECDTLSHDEVSDMRKLAAFLAASGGEK